MSYFVQIPLKMTFCSGICQIEKDWQEIEKCISHSVHFFELGLCERDNGLSNIAQRQTSFFQGHVQRLCELDDIKETYEALTAAITTFLLSL